MNGTGVSSTADREAYGGAAGSDSTGGATRRTSSSVVIRRITFRWPSVNIDAMPDASATARRSWVDTVEAIALRAVAKDGPRTKDLGGTATTRDVTAAVLAALKR